MNENPLKKLVECQKNGEPVGIYSCCSSNPFVLKAALLRGKETDSCVLIESTANQVDQFGGYSGMTPADFVKYVHELADEIGFNKDKLFLGGDHLGPLTFANRDESEAMAMASVLVHDYVKAGYTKIHLDTSMKVHSDDPDTRLSDEVIAARGAQLARVCEEAYQELLQENPKAIKPVYIVGSEVPIPGGSVAAVDEGVQVTRVEDFKDTYEVFRSTFEKEGLSDAFDQVIGFVVQPGVEEKDAGCTEYVREKAADLSKAGFETPGMVFEGHSTDYQTRFKLRELVEDGFAILKVGPGLTFAMREALYALAYAEKEWVKVTGKEPSNLMEVIEEQMLAEPKNWQKHYHGTEKEIAFKRKFSFSDRSRYYMLTDTSEKAINHLFETFKEGVPLGLLSQFCPVQYRKVREGKLENKPEAIVVDRIIETIDDYLFATKQEKLF